jgi:hypothetical protein
MIISNNLSIDNIIQGIKVQLKDVMNSQGGLGTITYLNISKPVADDTIKLQIRDHKGRIFAVVLCSSPVSPGLVARGIDKAAQVRDALNSELGQVILRPLMRGEFNSLTYVVLPYCKPISKFKLRRFLQRGYLRPRVLKWLRQVTTETMTEPSPDELQSNFLIPLKQIVANQRMSGQIHAAAAMAIKRLSTSQWHPRYVLAHNDFWEDNLLMSPNQQDNDFGFVIIDWPGANIRGHAICDLLRMAMSLKLTPRHLLDELQQHCRILDCSIVDATGYLLASLGFIGMHLEHFPMERYVALTENCYHSLQSLGE